MDHFFKFRSFELLLFFSELRYGILDPKPTLGRNNVQIHFGTLAWEHAKLIQYIGTFCFWRFSRVTLHDILSMNTLATSAGSAADVDVTKITAPPTVQVWCIYVLLDLFFPVVSCDFCQPKGGFSRSVCLQFLGVRELSWKISSVVYNF